MSVRPPSPGAIRSSSGIAVGKTLTALLGALALLSGGAAVTGAGAASAGVGSRTATARAASARASGGPIAVAARSVYLVETAHLHLTSEGESALSERGYASGTFSAPLSARLDLSASHVNAVFRLYPRGGTIVGRASARFDVLGSTAYYGGTLKIVRGTGAYRRASGSNIGISGTINRNSFALTVKANGWMRL